LLLIDAKEEEEIFPGKIRIEEKKTGLGDGVILFFPFF
jgi:hypothetical protein